MTTETYDFIGFYTIVLTEYIINVREIVQNILDDCWSLYIANVIVLAPTQDYKQVLSHTFFPYTPEYCECVQPIVVDRFENGKFTRGHSVPLFPDKFRNFHQCPLTLSSYNFTPFIIIIPQPNGTYYIDGIEGTIIRVISQRLNFTVNFLASRTNILKNITNSSNHLINETPKLPRSLDLVRFIVFISIINLYHKIFFVSILRLEKSVQISQWVVL